MKDRRATGIALAFAVLLVGGLGLSKIGDHRNAGPQPPVNPSSCLELRVLASSEMADLLKAAAAAYNTSGATLDGKCVQAAVVSLAPGAAEPALARGWHEKADGPGPDGWAAASSSWVVLL